MLYWRKVFPTLWHGSMHGQADLQLVFLYLVAHMERDGKVEIIPRALAQDCGLELERVEKALEALESPDPLSRTEAADGRRLIPLDSRGWGWQIVNWQKYQVARDPDARREQNRQAQARTKDRKRSAKLSQNQPDSAQGEGEGEVEKRERKEEKHSRSESDPKGFGGFWTPYPRKVGRRAAATAYRNAMKRHPNLEPIDFANASLWYADRSKATEERFIPHPATWLNQDRFLEEYAEETQGNILTGPSGI